MTPEDAVDAIAESGLLTRRQAEAYVHREIEVTSREATAEIMGVSVNVLDKHLRAARDKVTAAEATVEAIEDARVEELPDECSECGRTLGGAYSENDDGEAVCLECAGIDPDADPLGDPL